MKCIEKAYALNAPMITFEKTFKPGGSPTAIAWSPDGKLLATSDSLNLRITIWDFAAGTALHTVKRTFFGGNSLAFTSDGRYLLTSAVAPTGDDNRKSLSLIDVASGQIARDIDGPIEHSSNVATNVAQLFAVSSKGDHVAAITRTSNTEFLNIYDQQSWALLSTRQVPQLLAGIAYSSPDGMLAMSGFGGRLDVLSSDATVVIAQIKSHPHRGGAVAFSVDGMRLAVSDNPGLGNEIPDAQAIRLFDTRSWQSVTGTIASPGADFRSSSLSFSSDGHFLASMSYDGNVRLWDANSLSFVSAVNDGEKGGVAVAFSPNSHYLAIARDQEATVVRIRSTN
jgi:WD40 repeat protein